MNPKLKHYLLSLVVASFGALFIPLSINWVRPITLDTTMILATIIYLGVWNLLKQ